MARTPEELKRAKKLLKKPAGKLLPVDLTDHWTPTGMTRAYRNNHYTVMIFDNHQMTQGVKAILAMVQLHTDRPIPNHWREMQNIKNEIFGPETTAIEYYPAVSKLIDDANIYWLWILPDEALPKKT